MVLKRERKEIRDFGLGRETGARFLILALAFMVGCAPIPGNVGRFPNYAIPEMEDPWIREGHPLEFEGELWYPQDEIEILLDVEVILLGKYEGVQFFAEKRDIRPYHRLYTKFGHRQFRVFEKRELR